MNSSGFPSRFILPFANNGLKNSIPSASQTSSDPGKASLYDGFPLATLTPKSAGGVSPYGQDFNGVLHWITQAIQWANAGGFYPYNSDFAAAISGYPEGALLLSSDGSFYWQSTTDGNSTNPDSGGAGWIPVPKGFSAHQATVTTADVTLTPTQYACPVITVTGALTGDRSLIFPATGGRWTVYNDTTGAHTLTCKTAGGSGVVIAQGAKQDIFGDGANILAVQGNAALNLYCAPGSSANHAVNFGQFAGSLSASGYQPFPGGMIMQWGSVSSGSTGMYDLTFPIAFPNECLVGLATSISNSVAGADIFAIDAFSAATMRVWGSTDENTAASMVFRWFAIGH
jgi:hypothetical protein